MNKLKESHHELTCAQVMQTKAGSSLSLLRRLLSSSNDLDETTVS